MAQPPEPQSTGNDQGLGDRVDSLATWINDIEARLRVAELATGDERTAKELRRALEALSKHDPKLEKRVTDHVTVLTDRFETLASTVAQTAAALAAKDGEIAGLRRELEDAERRIRELGSSGRASDSKEIASLRNIVDALSAQRSMRTSDERVDELGGKIRLLGERVDSVTATVTAAAATLGRREADLAALRERLDHGSSRLDDVTAELRRLERDDTLAERLDTLQVAVVSASGALADREEEATALRARIDEAYSRVGSVVGELQQTVTGLSKQVASLETLPRTTAAELESRAAELNGKVDAVAERLDTMAEDVASSLHGLTTRDTQLSALYEDLEAERTRVDSLVAELKEELATLPDPGANDTEVESRLEILRTAVVAATTRLDEIEAAASTREEAARSRAGELAGALAELEGRLDSIDQASHARDDAAASRAAELDGSLAELAGRLDAAEQEREAAAEQLRTADEVWLEERDWVRRQLDRLAVLHESASHATESAGPQLEELAARLDGVEAARDAVSSEIVRVFHALDAERTSLQEQLDALHDAAPARPSVDPQLDELRARLDGVEAGREAAASEITRVSQALDSERAAVQEQLDALAAQVAEAAARGASGLSKEQLAGLAGRLEDLERRGTAVASELGRTTALWAAELESLGERLDRVDTGTRQETRHDATDRRVGALAARLDALARALPAETPEVAAAAESWAAERAAISERMEELSSKLTRVESAAQSAAAAAAVAASTSPDDGIAEIRALVDGVLTRMASAEKSVAAMASSAKDLEPSIEELGRRLESVERANMPLALPESDVTAAGDGRFRLELRSLELRMEHAEAAARENREAVLTQLERLASRVEWRLQTLEAAQEDDFPEPEPEDTGARVVPIRGGADS